MTFTRPASIRQYLFQHTRGASQHLDAVVFAMLKTITAKICLHPIRSSDELPHSTNGINFEVPYCGPCARSRQILAEHEIAECEHRLLEAIQQPGDDRSKLRAARIRYNRAHLAYLQDMERQAERYQKDHGVAPRCDPICKSTAHEPAGNGRPKKKVRFDSINDHRPEAQYRLQQRFDRTTSQYEPGLYANKSGTGFINTCDPYESDLSDEETEFLRDSDLDRDDGADMACSSAMEDCQVESQDVGNAQKSETAHAFPEEDDGPHIDGVFGQLSREEIIERRDVIQERLNQLMRARSERRVAACS